MQARQAIDGVRQRAGVELGQRLLGVLRERLQHLWRSPQHLLLALLPHQLAQRVPRGAEVDGPVLLAVLRVGVDDLAHGAKLAYPRHARQAATAGAAAQPRQAGAQQHQSAATQTLATTALASARGARHGAEVLASGRRPHK